MYQADVRARLELAERLRRRGAEEYAQAQVDRVHHDFSPEQPWVWVFRRMVSDACTKFWNQEIEVPALLVLSHASKRGGGRTFEWRCDSGRSSQDQHPGGSVLWPSSTAAEEVEFAAAPRAKEDGVGAHGE